MTAPARSIALVGLLILASSATACDRWRAPFRVTDRSAGLLAPVRTPLPDSGYRVRWEAHTVPAAMAPGASADVRIAFTNVGDVVWPDVLAGEPETRTGGHAVRLAYGWTSSASAPPSRPPHRADLPHPVHPGETMTLLVPLEAPAGPGEYRLTIELVQELVAWFDAKGAAPLVVPVTVR